MKRVAIALVVCGLMLTAVSCSKAEEVTVSKYFQAMKHNDKDTMASMAAEPKYLEYDSFDITEVSEPVVEEYELPALLQKMEELKKERTRLARDAGEKRDDLEDLKDELEGTRRGSRRNQLTKEIEDAQVAFYAAEQAFKDLVKKMGDLKRQIEAEKSLVTLSTGIKNQQDIYQGERHKSTATVKVTLTDGSVADYVFTLIKYAFSMEERTLPSRLIILKIQTAEEFQQAAQVSEEAETPTEEISEEPPAETEDEG